MGAVLKIGRQFMGEAEQYRLVSALFLRALALIYLAAFASLLPQLPGLVGSQGILPLGDTLDAARQQYGLAAWWRLPTVFWLYAADWFVQAAAAAGCVLAVLLFFNLRVRLVLVLLWVLYLSLFHAGQIFMNFQWDYLLLEAGFLAIFLPSGSRLVIFLFRWLLFRLRFLSGISKLLSGDPTWADLTALNYYFEVQPLPHWGSWYAHQLPEWLLRFGTGATLVIEILVPFMMFLPRTPRFISAWATIALQVIIILTSNHNFFNLLTIVLCLFLFDDRAVQRVVPRLLQQRLQAPFVRSGDASLLAMLMAGVILFASTVEMWEMLSGRRISGPVATVMRIERPLHLANRYHVFPVMQTERIELIVEGSVDGVHWRPYEFRYKPGDVERRPPFVVPHQPRLDWMMWFVPLGPPFLPWFEAFLERLLAHSPAVTGLLAQDPFPGVGPKQLRVRAYRYHFTDADARAATGAWWWREPLGLFLPLPGLPSAP